MIACCPSVESLRSLLDAAPAKGRGRYDCPQLIQQALLVIDQEMGRGKRLPQIADALGVPLSAVQRWRKQSALTGSSHVEQAPDFVSLQVSPSLPSSLVVHGPGAMRIEVLDLPSMAALLRSLVCSPL